MRFMSTNRVRHSTRTLACLTTMLVALPAMAQQAATTTATPLPTVQVDTASSPSGLDNGIGGTVISGEELKAKSLTSSDTAGLLKGVPGVTLMTGGASSSLPVMHGMADDRNKTLVDGMPITSSCPNHMNPALSYMAPSNAAEVEAIAGITPVSQGGDSIGGTISVQSKDPIFAKKGEGVHTEGMANLRVRSNNKAFGQTLDATAATEQFSARYHGDHEKGGNYHDGNGNPVLASRYEQSSHDLTLAAKAGDAVFTVQGGQKYTPYEGFPNEYMDMLWNRSHFLNGRYQGGFAWGDVDARAYWQNVKHFMDFLGERVNYANSHMPMYTDGTDWGYSVKATLPVSKQDTVRIGNELHRYTLDDWWPPTSGTANGGMSPNTFQTINDGERTVLGTFVEWDAKWSPQWSTLLGIRNDTVWSDAGNVQGYSATDVTGTGVAVNYLTDSNAFNAQDRSKLDVNWDLTALTRYEPTQVNTFDLGYARKTRSPNLYERYTWSTGTMAMRMINWFGDGNGYVGNVNLKPEIANTFSTSAGWHDAQRKSWDIKLTPYYSYIQDYIGVNNLGSVAQGGTTINKLQFANHDAQVYGLDLSGKVGLWENTEYGSGVLKGFVGWMHGEQINTGNSLYHMVPLNANLTLQHRQGGWTNAVELEMMADKSQADPLRKERHTPGYALVNLRTGYEWQNLAVGFAVENLFNKQYYSPLGGLDIADWRQTGYTGSPDELASMGRSLMADVTVKF